MKRILQLLTLSIFLFTLSCEKEEELIDLNAEKQLPKVEVCHYDEYTDTWTTISISENALKAHLAHGDFEGSCENRKTYVPDNGFEQHLINEGYDDVLDDYVLTSKIVTVEVLFIPTEIRYTDENGLPTYVEAHNLIGIEDFINLKTLVLPENPALSGELNLTGCINLESIGLSYNGLEKLDVTQNLKLKSVHIVSTEIEHIDLSNNALLTHVNITFGFVNSVNIKNGANTKIEMISIDNPYLTCIQVDDPDYSINNWPYVKPVYSTDCGY